MVTCYMIGGDQEAWDIVEPIFRDTAVEMDSYMLEKLVVVTS